VLLVEHDQVVQALAAQGPDHPFGDRVGLWRVNGAGDGVDTDAAGTLAEVATVDRIAIAKQVAM
jgi:hypothetical protein